MRNFQPAHASTTIASLSTAQRIKGIEITLLLALGMEAGCVAAVP